MVRAKKFIFAKRFKGLPKVTDFRLEEETLPALKNGGLFSYFLIGFKMKNLIIHSSHKLRLTFYAKE